MFTMMNQAPRSRGSRASAFADRAYQHRLLAFAQERALAVREVGCLKLEKASIPKNKHEWTSERTVRGLCMQMREHQKRKSRTICYATAVALMMGRDAQRTPGRRGLRGDAAHC